MSTVPMCTFWCHNCENESTFWRHSCINESRRWRHSSRNYAKESALCIVYKIMYLCVMFNFVENKLFVRNCCINSHNVHHMFQICNVCWHMSCTSHGKAICRRMSFMWHFAAVCQHMSVYATCGYCVSAHVLYIICCMRWVGTFFVHHMSQLCVGTYLVHHML